MNAAAQAQTPDYEHAVDCLTSLYDATAKLVSTAARGKRFSKSDLMEVSGIVQLARFLAEATKVDVTGAYVMRDSTPDSRRANRALLHLNHIMLERMRALMAPSAVIGSREAFERFSVRELYATAMEFAAATGVKVEEA